MEYNRNIDLEVEGYNELELLSLALIDQFLANHRNIFSETLSIFRKECKVEVTYFY